MAFPTTAQLMPVGDIDPADAKTYFTDWLTATRALLGDGSTAQVAREALGVAVPNWLDNPSGEVYQRTVAATADDAYAADRWYVLTQTGTVTPSQISNPEDGYRYGLRLTQSQAVAQRMGEASIIEGKDAIPLRGQTATFGGRFRFSTSQTLRYAILAWTGTEDAPVSDVVNSWTNATFTTGQFFNSTTLTLIGTSSTALTAATAATCSVSGTVPAGTTNLIVFWWTEATAAQNVTADRWGLRMVAASSLVDYIKRNYSDELARCQRYATQLAAEPIGIAITTSQAGTNKLPVTMRAIPTLSGGSFAASAGAAGTPTLNGYSSAATAWIVNTGSAWSVGAQITVTGLLSAEL